MNQESTAVITDNSEVLLRQVHPSHEVDTDAGISSEAFVPSEDDKDLLSTLRGRVDPAEAYRRWTEDLSHESLGTYGLAVAEVGEVGLRAIDDEVLAGVADHASIDFTLIVSKGQHKRRGRKLRDAAVERGCLHARPSL